MASLNPLTRELVFKIVFYGPGLGGKTTTLQYIYAATKAEHRGKMVSLATPTDRTLYFDYLPIRVPRVRGMSVRLQLFTVPGQVHFEATRRLVLSSADGVVFVADSQQGRLEANRESLEDLVDNLWENNRKLSAMPHTFHWNKRDLSDLVPVEELEKMFNPTGVPSLETVATRGDGVFSGLERITRLVLRAYEADLPKGEPSMSPGLGVTDMGIEDAIRSLTAPPAKLTPADSMPRSLTIPFDPKLMLKPILSREDETEDETLVALKVADVHMPSARPLPTFAPEEAAAEDLNHSEAPQATRSARAATPPPAHVAATSAAEPEALRMPSVGSPGPVTTWAAFSMAELWPETEREGVRLVEALIASSDPPGAILACDLLVTRLLASAGSLAGPADAPRDPGVVSLLLGLAGARYLAFRGAVRAARQKTPVTVRDACECYAFAIEARRARDSIGR